MPEVLQLTVDKFTFRVPRGLFYTQVGAWARPSGRTVRVGLSDFVQQRSGDVAFVEVKPDGTRLKAGDEIASLETIKVNTSLPSPVQGAIVEINPSLQDAPELINQDPYGEGWLAVVEVVDWETDKANLMDAEAYLAYIRGLAEAEVKG